MSKFATEKDLEDAMFSHMDKNKYCKALDEELYNASILRQFTIPGYGTPDMLTVEATCYGITVTVYELKNVPFECKHLCQIARYYTGICRYIEDSTNRYKEDFSSMNITIRGVLVCSSVDSQHDHIYLAQDIEWLSLLSYDVGMDGVSFEEYSGYFSKGEKESDSVLSLINKTKTAYLKELAQAKRAGVL